MSRSRSQKSLKKTKKAARGEETQTPDVQAPTQASVAGVLGKALMVMSLDDYHSALVNKADGSVGAPPGAPTTKPKKYPRKLKPTVRLTPVGHTPQGHPMRAISDEEAAANINAGKTRRANYEKSQRALAALKALATGYGKVSGGGALKAPNRDRPSISLSDVNRAMETVTVPAKVGPPKVYLPGIHNPKSPVRRPLGLRKPSRGTTPPANTKSMSSGEVKKGRSVKDQHNSASWVYGESKKTSVEKSNSGDQTMSKTNFNDLFKSELGASADDVLCDCPHCESPITKSDLEKARGHKGKGKLTGAKHGKSSAHVVEQNPTGGTMRGGTGSGVHTPSRGVPGAKKTDAVVGVQNSKGSHASKAVNDEDETGTEIEQPVKKSITVRGTEWVQYVDDGTDASIAKSIAEGSLGGTQPTQPMDLNHDLTRLLI